MRLNKYIAQATGMSRRAADAIIDSGRVTVNGAIPSPGHSVLVSDTVILDDTLLAPPKELQTIILNKPRGYVCSRNGQGSRTVYDLLPSSLHHLKPVGRLDKDSSGLLLLTNDGDLANQLTHPSHQKTKVYKITLDKPLAPLHQQMISDYGVRLEDGPSKFMISHDNGVYIITMHEGRNRQIRRTFAALGYNVRTLQRISFGPYALEDVALGSYATVQNTQTT